MVQGKGARQAQQHGPVRQRYLRQVVQGGRHLQADYAVGR